MSTNRLTRTAVALSVAIGVAVIGVVVWQVRAGQRLPDGPVPIAWGKEACGHCHMHVSEERFAVQAQTTAGEVLDFDDPGCFFAYLDAEHPDLHAVWFRHSREDRWLAREQVGFVTGATTPMDFGLAAVDASEPGALGFEEARARAAAKGHGGGATGGMS